MLTSQGVESFLAFLRQSEQNHQIANTECTETEQQTQDILHAVELGSYNPQLTAKLTKKLREVRQRRRTAKDTLEATGYVVEWIAQNQGAIKSLERLLGDLRKAERRNMNRAYGPRTNIMDGLGSSNEDA